jgi:hypothetical protein
MDEADTDRAELDNNIGDVIVRLQRVEEAVTTVGSGTKKFRMYFDTKTGTARLVPRD